MALSYPDLKQLSLFLPGWIEVVMVLALSWIVAGIFVKPLMPGAGQLSSGFLVAEDHSVNIGNLITTVPFGKPAVVERSNGPVVKSRLAIKLLGTIVAGDLSAALVQPKPGAAEEVFHIDDVIMSGVILKGVESTRILIDVSGRREIIMLDESATVNTAPFQPASPGSQAANNGGREATNPPAVQHLRISRYMLDNEMDNMVRLMTQARLTLQTQNGKPGGYLITEIVPGSLYQRIGLRNGDIIQGINGMTPTSMSQASSILKTLKESERVEMSLQRNEQQLSLQYDIR